MDLPKPLVARADILATSGGSVIVDEHYLTMLDRTRFDVVNEIISALSAANPEYFFTPEPLVLGGIRIRWYLRTYTVQEHAYGTLTDFA